MTPVFFYYSARFFIGGDECKSRYPVSVYEHYSVVYFGQQRGTRLVRSIIEYYVIIINLLLFSSKNRCTITVIQYL